MARSMTMVKESMSKDKANRRGATHEFHQCQAFVLSVCVCVCLKGGEGKKVRRVGKKGR
jgi:hypothetical protein